MLACSPALTTSRATETNTAGADFGAGRIDDLDDILHRLDEVGADLRIRRQIQTLRVGFSIGKRNRIHCYNTPLYFIFTKIPRPRRRYCHATPSPLLSHHSVAVTVTPLRRRYCCSVFHTLSHFAHKYTYFRFVSSYRT